MEHSVSGIATELQPYGFAFEQNRAAIQKGQFHPVPSTGGGSEDLENCFAGWVGGTPLLRSGAIFTHRKALEFLELAKLIHQDWKKDLPLRISSNQQFSLHTEWDATIRQHQQLMEVESTHLVHVVTPLDPLIATHPPRILAESDIRDLLELPKLMNMEAWVTYLSWFNELLGKAFAGFNYDAVDEYTLERHIKEFDHEVNNLYLKESRKRLSELQRSLGIKEPSYKETVQAEKEMIVVRKAIQRMVKDHYDHLVDLVAIIPVIEKAHPELIPLKWIGRLLAAFLAPEVNAPEAHELPWGQKQMLLQLLDGELGVVSAVNDPHGVGRCSVSFALRLAALQTAIRFGKERIFDLALHFNRGNPAGQPRQESFKFLKECFLENLEKICIPIVTWNRKEVREPTKKDVYLNEEILLFLPPSMGSKSQIHELLNYISLSL